MDKQRFISVPENSKSMEKYYYGIESKEEMIEWILPHDAQMFNKLLDEYNEQYGVIYNNICEIVYK